ncbi:hypothetical protein [Haloferax sulfurifontis]|uniref:Uncharacterized protein n=1 Tax=Haloferax sulfurifontis ATCC BAA-897 TaxID=662480 RepID=M0IHC8_9EURY|nr:hypothetical protein [Haloferax sulfurifontis]ELZ96166.1 hypothetical protein C441_04974 [Haloferax sulfurifontis ATCC BAA-897]
MTQLQTGDTHIANDEIDLGVIRDALSDRGDATDDASVVDVLYKGHVRERIQSVTGDDVPDRPASVARDAFGKLVDGNRDAAVSTSNRRVWRHSVRARNRRH